MTLPGTATVEAEGTLEDMNSGPTVLALTYGHLHDTMCGVPQLLLDATRATWPQTPFRIEGQSSMRFLLREDGAVVEQAAEQDHAGAERKVVGEMLDSLARPDSLLEAVEWMDGPTRAAVTARVGEQVQVRWDEDDVHDLHRGQQVVPVWPSRRYSPATFMLAATAASETGRQYLAGLGCPPLPDPLGAPVTYEYCHTWLADIDLQWYGPTHPARIRMGVLSRLLPNYHDGYADPEVAAQAIADGLLHAVEGVSCGT